MTKFSPQHFLVLLFFATSLMPMADASATCTRLRSTLGVYFSLPERITVARDAPIGTVLASNTASFSREAILRCEGTIRITVQSFVPGARYDRKTGVYDLPNDVGFGFRISMSGVSWGDNDYTFGNESPTDYPLAANTNNLRLELVKTRALIVSGSTFGAQWLLGENADGNEFISWRLDKPATVTLATTTCTPLTASNNQTISLGTVSAKDFKRVGSTSDHVANFALSLNCQNYAGSVFVTFTDANTPGNRSNALGLTGGNGAATGLGVQLRFGEKIIAYGAQSSTADTSENSPQFKLFTSTGVEADATTRRADFTARYVQTADQVGPGAAAARAIATFSYQ